MRPDLLDAQANVDWAVSQLESFEKRVESWLSLNVDITIEETPPPATHDVIVAIEKTELPRSFNVEVGAYINAIRSSLDLLASTLAIRHSIAKPEDAYFPVATSEASFLAGNYKGSKFVKALPDAERQTIESLKPYQGGNDALWALHHLDIVRKHRRLIGAEVRPLRFSIMGFGPLKEDFTPVTTGWLRTNQKSVLALLRKGAPNYNFKYIPHVAISEPGYCERKPTTATIVHLADMASTIIKMFDI